MGKSKLLWVESSQSRCILASSDQGQLKKAYFQKEQTQIISKKPILDALKPALRLSAERTHSEDPRDWCRSIMVNKIIVFGNCGCIGLKKENTGALDEPQAMGRSTTPTLRVEYTRGPAYLADCSEHTLTWLPDMLIIEVTPGFRKSQPCTCSSQHLIGPSIH